MKTNVLKILIVNFCSLALSCHYMDLSLPKSVIFKGDYYFHYKDYSKFSRELKELYKYNITFMDKKDVESQREELISNYVSKWGGYDDLYIYKAFFVNKNIYNYNRHSSETILKSDLKNDFIKVKELLQDLTRLNLENEITYDVLKPYSIFYNFYRYIYYIMTYKNQYGDLKKYYSDFDILFVKEALAKGTKILIYHFPSLYKDLAYLFEERDDYFK